MLQQRLVRKTITDKRQIIERGDPVSGAYFVLEGRLRVFAVGKDGREVTLYRIEPGETCILALNAMFNDLLYPAWVETEMETTIGILPGEAYRTMFAAEPVLQDMTIKALSSVVFGLMASLEERSIQTINDRLINYLLLSANSQGILHNTQQEIADRIGTTREVVGKHMATYAARNFLKTSRGTITLLDIHGLGRHLQSG